MSFGLKNTVALAERRREARRDAAIRALIDRTDHEPLAVDIEIISPRGFLARTELVLPQGTLLRVRFPSGKAPHARIVWIEQGKMGGEFLTRMDVSELLIDPASSSRPPNRVLRSIGLRVVERVAAFGRRGDQYEMF